MNQLGEETTLWRKSNTREAAAKKPPSHGPVLSLYESYPLTDSYAARRLFRRSQLISGTGAAPKVGHHLVLVPRHDSLTSVPSYFSRPSQ